MTVLFNAESATPRATARPAAMLPLLVILFVVSYCILTMLVFEQGQTIESQRGLIREMLKDSNQLSALKGKLSRDDSKRTHDKDNAAAQNHSGADSNNAAAGLKGPDVTGPDKDSKHPGKSARSMKEVPGKPAADLEDVRRATHAI